MKEDINNREDLLNFLRKFYNRAQIDEIIGEKFTGINIESHIEIIADFWGSMIHGTNSYNGDPFGKHIPMKLTNADFDRWLELFEITIDEDFEGVKAEEMKQRANSIATVFRYKLVQ